MCLISRKDRFSPIKCVCLISESLFYCVQLSEFSCRISQFYLNIDSLGILITNGTQEVRKKRHLVVRSRPKSPQIIIWYGRGDITRGTRIEEASTLLTVQQNLFLTRLVNFDSTFKSCIILVNHLINIPLHVNTCQQTSLINVIVKSRFIPQSIDKN